MVVEEKIELAKYQTKLSESRILLSNLRKDFISAYTNHVNLIKNDYDLAKQYADSSKFILEYNKLIQKKPEELNKEIMMLYLLHNVQLYTSKLNNRLL